MSKEGEIKKLEQIGQKIRVGRALDVIIPLPML